MREVYCRISPYRKNRICQVKCLFFVCRLYGFTVNSQGELIRFAHDKSSSMVCDKSSRWSRWNDKKASRSKDILSFRGRLSFKDASLGLLLHWRSFRRPHYITSFRCSGLQPESSSRTLRFRPQLLSAGMRHTTKVVPKWCRNKKNLLWGLFFFVDWFFSRATMRLLYSSSQYLSIVSVEASCWWTSW